VLDTSRTDIAKGLTIRPLRREEIAQLAQVIPDELSEAQLENRWQEQELGYREVLVAEADGELVGTVSIRRTHDSAPAMHLFALEVATHRRGEGIGSAIIEYVIDEARRRGCRSVYLEVRVDNRARRLYHRAGFRRVGGAFVNSWWQFGADGSRERVEELSYRMVKRVGSNKQQATGNKD
jgi:ribosomal protein S18 acetylase RimI-like enzyme